MRILLSILLTISPIMGFAQTLSKQAEFNSALGTDYESNLIKNPSAYKNINNVTGSGTPTVTRDTDAADQIDGKASFNISLDAGEYLEFDLNTPSSEQTVGNCGFKGIFKGNATPATVEIVDGSNNVLVDIDLTNETDWREFKMWHPCGASGARKVRINNVTGPTRVINIGKLYYGRMEPGAGVPPNTYSSSHDSNGTVRSGSQTPSNWIGNCIVTDTSLYTCPISATFSAVPKYQIQPMVGGDEIDRTRSAVIIENNTTTTQLQFRLMSNIGGSSTSDPARINITAELRTSDYIQPAITPNNFNFDWKNYTGTITQSSGTLPARTLNYMQFRRDGSKGYFRGKFTFTATGTWSGIIIPTPPGITMSSTSLFPVVKVGLNDVSVSAYEGTATKSTSTISLWAFGSGGSGIFGDITQAFPFTWVSGDTVEWEIGPVDILENGVPWTENQGAPQLVGSVTTDENSAIKIESSSITCSGTSAVDSGILIGNVGNISSGICALTWAKQFSGSVRCWANSSSTTGALVNLSVINASNTGASLVCKTQSGGTTGTCSSISAHVFCTGAR